MRIVRVFISSPGDTRVERRRVERVVSRLNGEFAGLARLETIRWETAFYRADETFQAQIPPAVDCDIVLGILRWRLGTELPPGFVPQPDGDPYPSGTAYELLTAIDRRRSGAALPDVFVFRYAGGAPSIVIGEAEEAAKRRDWSALQAFFARWFVSEAGHFTAALNTYASEDDFERQAEALLRDWVAETIAAGRAVPWPAGKGSPFRGLDAFGARHAQVFFGRDADIRRATDLFREAAARGTPFLLLLGASGAGKSSLLRAGLVPRLTTPGVVPEVDLWRAAVLRPGDGPDGPFAALAAALLRDTADLPPDEESRGPALPEIAEGDAKTPADLAALLAHGDETAVRCLLNALARVGDRARTGERFERILRCHLVLVLDQAEELFAPSVADAVRTAFAGLLGRMAASGRIWIAATLRADLYAAFIAVPELRALKDAGHAVDLAPPGSAELAEIVRAPAKAAGLVFDVDPATGERLDAMILREADRPDMLPLVQLALSRLWEARVTRGAETVLPLAAYRAIGGLEGIIAEAGAAALAGRDPAVLPALIRRLAELAPGRGQTRGGATLTTRSVPLAEAAPDPAARALVDALVQARLLSLADEAGATVRLAHQRVLSDWPAAAEIVAHSADFYRVRDEVEAARRRWEAGRRRGDLLLPRGLPLAEARAMAMRYARELAPATLAYIAASRRRANRALVLAWCAAAVFALVAVGAVVEGKMAVDERSEAERQTRAAERNFDAARAAVDGLVVDIVGGLSGVGLPVATTTRILETARQTIDRLVAAAPDSTALQNSRARMLMAFGDVYQSAGDLKDEISAYEASLSVARRLAAQDPDAAGPQRNLLAVLDRIVNAKLAIGDSAGALSTMRESLSIARRRVARGPDDAEAQGDLAHALLRIGDLTRRTGDRAQALAAYEEALALRRSLALRSPDDLPAQRALSLNLERIGDLKLQAGDRAAATARYEESLAEARHAADRHPADREAQRDLWLDLLETGDFRRMIHDRAGARAVYEQGVALARGLAARDVGNLQTQRDISLSLERLGEVELESGDGAGARTALDERVALCRALADADVNDADARRDLAFSLEEAGDAALATRESGEARRAYEEAVGILRRLAAADPARASAQRDFSISLDRVGSLDLQTGDLPAALDAFRENLSIVRTLAARDGSNVRAQHDLAASLTTVGDVASKMKDATTAVRAYAECVALLDRLGAGNADDRQLNHEIVVARTRLADAELMAGDRDAALAALQQALALAEALAGRDPADKEAAIEVAWVRSRIASLGDGTPPAASEERPIPQK